MKRTLLEQVLLYDYRYLIGYFFVVVAAAYFLFWRLGSLLPGLGLAEANYLNGFADYADILSSPSYLPHKLLSLLVQQQFGSTELSLRLVSASFAAVGLLAFFVVVRYRFRARIAIAAVALLATSSWWLAYARSARPEILLPVTVFSIMFVVRKVHETRKFIWLLALMTLIGLALYIPLMIYVLLVGIFALRSLIIRTAAEYSPFKRSLALGWLIILVLPLLYAMFKDVAVGRELLGLPASWPGFIEILSNISNGIAELFWSASEENWSLRLGRLPLLDLFTAIMLALGLYHLDQEVSRSLAHFVLSGLGVLLVLTHLNSDAEYNALLIPFIYLLVAAGIVMLVSQWYEIFPRNPIARMTAFLPTIILLAAVVSYHHQRYFIAWAGSQQVSEVYPPISSYLLSELERLDTLAPERAFVVVEDDKLEIAQLLSRTHPFVVVTSVPSAPDTNTPIIFSAPVFARLDPDLAKVLRPNLTPVHSSYLTQSIVLWRYQPSP